jgi:hypothetical protein
LQDVTGKFADAPTRRWSTAGAVLVDGRLAVGFSTPRRRSLMNRQQNSAASTLRD